MCEMFRYTLVSRKNDYFKLYGQSMNIQRVINKNIQTYLISIHFIL